MSGIDDILSYKKNPDEDFYAMLNCDENSSVSADSRWVLRNGRGEFSGKTRNYFAVNGD